MHPIITTYSGKEVCILDIKPEDIEMEDIARGLSNTCRFAGQLRHFYSVAQHSVLCAELAERLKYPKNVVLAAFFHDQSESLSLDFPAPYKKNLCVSTLPHGHIISISELEDRLDTAFNARFGLNLDFKDPRVKYVDKVMVNTESYYLRGKKVTEKYPILNSGIDPLPPKEAYLLFMDKVNQLLYKREEIRPLLVNLYYPF
jgi:hypothetical protein